MQYWIYFQTGQGGDGLANLFEHAHNVEPIDNDDKTHWRLHRWVDYSPKFWAPNIDTIGCFRVQPIKRFDSKSNQLNQRYIDLVRKKQNIIVTSHDVTLDCLHRSRCQEILNDSQFKIILTTDDPDSAYINGAIKNLQTTIDINRQLPHVDASNFDMCINVKQFQTNYAYAKTVFQQLHLDIDTEAYKQYLQLQNGNMALSPFCNEAWVSNRCGNQVNYTRIS